MSLKASGKLAGITFLFRRKTDIAEKTPVVPDAQTPLQREWRHMYQKAVALWHALSPGEKQEWESLARPKHMTGFAWFMSQCLRPNPGIYLPLQGGTMSGDIDMASNRIRNLPGPLAGDEAIRLIDYVTQILPYLHHHGARVFKSANQNIPNNTWTSVTFDREDYDTDTIHDNVVSNTRLTCKTAGKYIIVAEIWFAHNAAGERQARFVLNGVTSFFFLAFDPTQVAGLPFVAPLATIWDLPVTDFVELQVYQNSGAGLNLDGGVTAQTHFAMQRIG